MDLWAVVPVKELDRQFANWATADAFDVMQTWIGRFGDEIEFVVSGNDAMALGAVEALRSAGMITDTQIVPVVGVNALPEVADLISGGIVLASILTNPAEQARAALSLGRIAALTGDPYNKWTEGTEWELLPDRSVRVADTVITAENVQVAVDAYISS